MEFEIFQPEPGTAYIYKLVDPRTDQPRYVGSTVNPFMRLNVHCTDQYAKRNKVDWIRELKAEGLKPRMIVVDQCPEPERFKLEFDWIKRYFNEGHDLTNNRPVEPIRSAAARCWPVQSNSDFFKEHPDCMGVRDAMALLSVSRSKVYELVKSKKLIARPKVNPIRQLEPLLFDRAVVEALKS